VDVSQPRDFRLLIRDREQDVRRTVSAETFFEARRLLAEELHVEPGEVVLDPAPEQKA
jgi:hypothetical protein